MNAVRSVYGQYVKTIMVYQRITCCARFLLSFESSGRHHGKQLTA